MVSLPSVDGAAADAIPHVEDYKALLAKLDLAQIDSDAAAKDKAPVSGSDAAQIDSDAAANDKAPVNGSDAERTDLADGDCSDSDDDVPLPPMNGEPPPSHQWRCC
jgi:sulfur carrier protein ThiS